MRGGEGGFGKELSAILPYSGVWCAPIFHTECRPKLLVQLCYPFLAFAYLMIISVLLQWILYTGTPSTAIGSTAKLWVGWDGVGCTVCSNVTVFI